MDCPCQQNGIFFQQVYKPLPEAEQQIYRLISDITISMKSADHLRMPELVSSRYTVYLSEEEEQRYAALKQDLVLQLPDGDITAANAASLSGKLSQMANGAVYMDSGDTISIHDRKLDALEDIIEAANGKPVRTDGCRKSGTGNLRKPKTNTANPGQSKKTCENPREQKYS